MDTRVGKMCLSHFTPSLEIDKDLPLPSPTPLRQDLYGLQGPGLASTFRQPAHFSVISIAEGDPMRINSLTAIIILIFSTGCNKWVHEDNWGGGFWSEDDQALAITRVLYERENKMFAARTRNWSFKIYTAPANNINQTTQRGPQMAGSIEAAYYMRNLDYVITVARLRNNSGDTIRIDQLWGDGTVRQLRSLPANGPVLTCAGESWTQEISQPIHMIPNPNGSLLAFVQFRLDCDGLTALVEFIDSNDGSIQSSETIALPNNMTHTYMANNSKNFSAFHHLAWNNSGEFMLGFDETNGERVTDTIVGWLLSPQGSRTELPTLDANCFLPSTTSSYLSAAGQLLIADNETDSLSLETISEATEAFFGCQ